MKKAFIFILLNILAVSALSAGQFRACEMTEHALASEIQNLTTGAGQTVEDHIKAARVYGSMARRGCTENFHVYREMNRASIQTARALVDINATNPTVQYQQHQMINRVVHAGF